VRLGSAALVAKARDDLVAFAGLVLRDERTGQHVTLQPFQREILRALQTEARCAIFSAPETGKSQLLAACLAWQIGRDPSLRCAIISATVQQAERLLRLAAIVIASPDYQEVFPDRRIERQTANDLFVTGRPDMKDANLIASAFALSSMLGQRLDYVACDDITTRESLLSQQARDRAYADFIAVTSSRLSPNGRMALVNSREHSDDLPSRLVKLPGWSARSFPILDEQGQSIWPSVWSPERIAKRRAELGERRFLTTMMAQPAPEGGAIFVEQDIARAFANGVSLQHNNTPDGKVICAVDPAWTTKITSDLSAIVLIVVEPGGYLHLTHIETWRLPSEQLVNRVVTLARTAHASVAIEANAAGQVLNDMIVKRGVPCKAYPTTRASKEFAVESLSTALAAGRFSFTQPMGAPGPELLALRNDLLTFAWDGAHTGDRLSALLTGMSAVAAIVNRPRGGVHRLDLLSR
jgi:hypothetical protein